MAYAKNYLVGDSVYVWFDDSKTMEMLPQLRIVAEMRVLDSSSDTEVTFTTGEKVIDNDVSRVFATQALCAAYIVNQAITRYHAAVLLDTTTSGASTAAQTATGLIRKS